MISILIITKGQNSVNIARRGIVLVLCISSNQDLHLYQVCENILNSLRVMEWT